VILSIVATVFPPRLSRAAWLHFRFPLSLRLAGEMLTARGIEVSHESVCN
jgi:transposase-like protein